jgi:O-antigen/teichoic acid export membrane protein
MGSQPPCGGYTGTGRDTPGEAGSFGPGMSLTNRTISGMLWNMSGAAVQAVLQLAIVAVLARLLSPQDFGVVGAAVVVIEFCQIFTQIGVGPALVQRSDLREEHVRAGFTLSLLIGVVFGGLLYLSAPWLARFFRMESLSSVIRVLALGYPLAGPTVVAEALLLRHMQFPRLVAVEVVSYALSYGAIGITLAALGWGIWALVTAYLFQIGIRTAGFFLVGSLGVGFSLNWTALRDLLTYGAGFSLARIANCAALRADQLVVGRWLGAQALGIYGRAYCFVGMPANLFGTVVDRAIFPALALVQKDRRRLAEAYSRAVALVAMTTLPVSAVLFALAPEIVYLLLGPHWNAVVLPFRILVTVLVFRTSYKMSDSLARATGAVYRRAWRQWMYAGAVLLGAWLGHFWGTPGVAAGVAVSIVLNFILMLQLSLKLTGVSWRALTGVHLRHTLVAVLLGAVAWACAHLVRTAGIPPYVSLVSAGLAAMAALLLLMSYRPGVFGDEGGWAWFLVKSRIQAVVLAFSPTRNGAAGSAKGHALRTAERAR